jgi:hypothetical protein
MPKVSIMVPLGITNLIRYRSINLPECELERSRGGGAHESSPVYWRTFQLYFNKALRGVNILMYIYSDSSK